MNSDDSSLLKKLINSQDVLNINITPIADIKSIKLGEYKIINNLVKNDNNKQPAPVQVLPVFRRDQDQNVAVKEPEKPPPVLVVEKKATMAAAAAAAAAEDAKRVAAKQQRDKLELEAAAAAAAAAAEDAKRVAAAEKVAKQQAVAAAENEAKAVEEKVVIPKEENKTFLDKLHPRDKTDNTKSEEQKQKKLEKLNRINAQKELENYKKEEAKIIKNDNIKIQQIKQNLKKAIEKDDKIGKEYYIHQLRNYESGIYKENKLKIIEKKEPNPIPLTGSKNTNLVNGILNQRRELPKGYSQGGKFTQSITGTNIIFKYIEHANGGEYLGTNQNESRFPYCELILNQTQTNIILLLQKYKKTRLIYAFLCYLILNKHSQNSQTTDLRLFEHRKFNDNYHKNDNKFIEQTKYLIKKALEEPDNNRLLKILFADTYTTTEGKEEMGLFKILHNGAVKDYNYNKNKSILDTFYFYYKFETDKQRYLEFEINGKIGYETPDFDKIEKELNADPQKQISNIEKTVTITFTIDNIVFKKWDGTKFGTFDCRNGDKSVITHANAYNKDAKKPNAIFDFNNEVDDFAEILINKFRSITTASPTDAINDALFQFLIAHNTTITVNMSNDENIENMGKIKNKYFTADSNNPRNNEKFFKLIGRIQAVIAAFDEYGAAVADNNPEQENLRFKYRNMMKSVKMSMNILLLRIQIYDIIADSKGDVYLGGGGGGGGHEVGTNKLNYYTRRHHKNVTRKK